MRWLAPIDSERLRAVLCDADGNLFPSEEPAFDASVDVTNRFLTAIGSDRRVTARELRLASTGVNFRSTAQALAAETGITVGPAALAAWVEEERRVVTEHLAHVLVPDATVLGPLRRLASAWKLAVVTSSASSRVATCMAATGIDELVPRDRLFSAEDSLPAPMSKPHPDVYLHAGARMGVSGREAVTVEDSVPGVLAAVRAGFPVIGLLMFVPPAERAERERDLIEAGATGIATSWLEVADGLASGTPTLSLAGVA